MKVGKSKERSIWWYSYWPRNGENFFLNPYKFKLGDNIRVPYSYFSPFLKVRQCAYNTRLSQSDGIILHVPQYQPSIYKSTKQFGLSFAYDAPKIWNEFPDDVRSATSIVSFRKKLKAYLFCQAYPP